MPIQPKIRIGQVSGTHGNHVTDPNQASKLAKIGSANYQQANNFARAGKIDSIAIDVKNQCIPYAYTFGVNFVVDLARAKFHGKTNSQAVHCALKNAAQTTATVAISGVITSQLLRTPVAAGGAMLLRNGVKSIAKNTLGKSAVEQIATASLGTSTCGITAVNHVSKLLRNNVATAVVTTAVVSAPDFYRAAFSKSISWKQFSKNLTVNAVGVAGSTGGWFAGAAAGAAFGSIVPGVGTALGSVVGGFIGSFGGCSLAALAAKTAANHVWHDDSDNMLNLLQEQIAKTAADFCLSESEIKQLNKIIAATVDANWLRCMYASGRNDSSRQRFAADFLESCCQTIVEARLQIAKPAHETPVNSTCAQSQEAPVDGPLIQYQLTLAN